ncbi:MAG: restriction endonuclease [Candidatus Obscuribacterales bacterium]|nr:restriction endonuclease [Candidatus Obscuribacterales bacterium]
MTKNTKGSKSSSSQPGANQGNLGFMHKLYDWAGFEKFVSTLYEDGGEVVVERNKIETDKYGARRETDIKITERKKLHTYVTLVECKRWKDPVSRDRVDVLAASLDGLNAQKGVIFTTKGYEAGAESYAKGKGIDLFIVRELTDEEWGFPGRHIQFYKHLWTGQFSAINIPNAALTLLIEDFSGALDLDVELSSEKVLDPTYDLYSVKDGRRGQNLISLLVNGHALILKHLSSSVGIQQNNGKDIALLFAVSGRFDFEGTEFRQLRIREGAINLKDIFFTFVARVDQGEFRFDRGQNVELAVAVEDFLNEKRYLAVQNQGEEPTSIQLLAKSVLPTPGELPMENGTVLRMFTAPGGAVNTEGCRGGGTIRGRMRLMVTTVTENLALHLEFEAKE